jgi:hypothetical protein
MPRNIHLTSELAQEGCECYVDSERLRAGKELHMNRNLSRVAYRPCEDAEVTGLSLSRQLADWPGSLGVPKVC